MKPLDEHALIARFFRPLATDPAAFDLLDDAAALAPPAGCDLVLTKDGIAEGVHFLPGEEGDAVARKVLRVNLSDLAAKGAEPLGYLVLLALPERWTEDWLASFADGLAEDQKAYRVALYGGDTIRAPGLVAAVTAIGKLPSGSTVHRAGAQAGDIVFVSGSIGDGALGLMAARGETALASLHEDERRFLIGRYRLPEPRVALASVLREHASAAMDVSDGLAGDLDKLCRASALSARVECERVPLSPAAKSAVAFDPRLFDLCATGGDDYEILCTVPPDRASAFEAEALECGTRVTAIGEMISGEGAATFLDRDGEAHGFALRSFSHTG